jgi:hypothetical protein
MLRENQGLQSGEISQRRVPDGFLQENLNLGFLTEIPQTATF